MEVLRTLLLLLAFMELTFCEEKEKVKKKWKLPKSVSVLSGRDGSTGSAFVVATELLSEDGAAAVKKVIKRKKPSSVFVLLGEQAKGELFGEPAVGDVLVAAKNAIDGLGYDCPLIHADVPVNITGKKMDLVPEKEKEWLSFVTNLWKEMLTNPDKAQELMDDMKKTTPNLLRVAVGDRATHISFKMQTAMAESPSDNVVAIMSALHAVAVRSVWDSVDEEAFNAVLQVPKDERKKKKKKKDKDEL